MAYGWTPEQMARVNERRLARGRNPLDPGNVGEKYAERYSAEYEKRNLLKQKKKEQPEEYLTPLQKYLRDIELRKSIKLPIEYKSGMLA